MSWQSGTSIERYVPIKVTDTFWSKLLSTSPPPPSPLLHTPLLLFLFLFLWQGGQETFSSCFFFSFSPPPLPFSPSPLRRRSRNLLLLFALAVRSRNVLDWCILSEGLVSDGPGAHVTFMTHISCFTKMLLWALSLYRRWDAVILGLPKFSQEIMLQTDMFSINWFKFWSTYFSFYFKKFIGREWYNKLFSVIFCRMFVWRLISWSSSRLPWRRNLGWVNYFSTWRRLNLMTRTKHQHLQLVLVPQ